MYYPKTPVAMNLITIDKVINNVKAEPNGIYYTTDTNEVYIYTTDKIWVKLADGITIEVKKKKYTNRRLKCPSCGALLASGATECMWCDWEDKNNDW